MLLMSHSWLCSPNLLPSLKGCDPLQQLLIMPPELLYLCLVAPSLLRCSWKHWFVDVMALEVGGSKPS